MDVSAADFAEARALMVDGQLRPNKVSDPRILKAARDLPRELFLPPPLRALAYLDEDVPLGNGRVLMEPLVLARLAQLAAPRPGAKGLVVGAGPGYGAALLAACGVAVTALEEDTALVAEARAALMHQAPAVRLIAGPLAEGWPAGAPWDIILIEGAVASIPEALVGQLQIESGRLVTVLQEPGSRRMGRAVLVERTEAGMALRPVFDCATPLLPAFAPKPAFVF